MSANRLEFAGIVECFVLFEPGVFLGTGIWQRLVFCDVFCETLKPLIPGDSLLFDTEVAISFVNAFKFGKFFGRQCAFLLVAFGDLVESA